jgi:hypothetical protein
MVHTWQAFEDETHRKIFEHKSNDWSINGQFRIICIEELSNFCRSFSVVMIVKCERLWCAGNVAGMGQWIWKFNIVHFPCNYITYIIFNTNILRNVFIC